MYKHAHDKIYIYNLINYEIILRIKCVNLHVYIIYVYVFKLNLIFLCTLLILNVFNISEKFNMYILYYYIN